MRPILALSDRNVNVKRKVKQIAEIQIGYQFREKLDTTSDGKYQVVQAKDIDQLADHRLNTSNLYCVTPKRSAEKYEVKNRDVIFLSKGRRNYATFITGLEDNIKTIVAGYFFILRLKCNDIIPAYLSWSINQSPAQNYLQSVSRGSGMPFIPKDAFTSLEVYVPPINVQEQIIKLYELSLQESMLLKQLEEKKSKLISRICIEAAKRKQEM